MRFSDKQQNSSYVWASLLKCSHMLYQCHQGLWIAQVNLTVGSGGCYSLSLCHQYGAEKSTHTQQ